MCSPKLKTGLEAKGTPTSALLGLWQSGPVAISVPLRGVPGNTSSDSLLVWVQDMLSFSFPEQGNEGTTWGVRWSFLAHTHTLAALPSWVKQGCHPSRVPRLPPTPHLGEMPKSGGVNPICPEWLAGRRTWWWERVENDQARVVAHLKANSQWADLVRSPKEMGYSSKMHP